MSNYIVKKPQPVGEMDTKNTVVLSLSLVAGAALLFFIMSKVK